MFGRGFHRERERLALRLDEEIRASLSDDDVPPVNDALEEVYGEFAVGTHPQTREMRFFLEDPRAFSPGLIARLRRLVADEFPKWTVVPQFGERSFVVTARGVVFGDAWVRDPVTADTAVLREWWANARRTDEEKYGPYRRQLGWLRPRVPGALARLASEPVVLLGAFERLRLEGHAVWVLVARPRDGVDFVHSGEQLARLDRYAVTADGTVHPQHSRRFSALEGEPPAAWLVSYLSERPFPGVLEVYTWDDTHAPDGSYTGSKRGPLLRTIDVPTPLDDRALPPTGQP
jgi:hypothetical protein